MIDSSDIKAAKAAKRALFLIVILWIVVAIAPFLAFTAAPQLNAANHESWTSILGQLGSYGDMFNVLTSLVTGLALCGVIYTSLLQRRQIAMQVDELEAAQRQLLLTEASLKSAESERADAQQRALEQAGHAKRELTSQAEARMEAQRLALKQQSLALRSAILQAQTAIATIRAQLTTGKISDGERQRREEKAEAWISTVESQIHSFNADLASITN